jgi:hypothetical protein
MQRNRADGQMTRRLVFVRRFRSGYQQADRDRRRNEGTHEHARVSNGRRTAAARICTAAASAAIVAP